MHGLLQAERTRAEARRQARQETSSLTHAVPAPWARSFVEAVASRRGRNVAEPPLPGPIRAREWLEESRTDEEAWRLVTRPAYVVLSAVYGADAELDVGTLKELVDSQALAPQQTFLGLTVEQE